MCCTCFVLCYLVLGFPSGHTRKYDIEAESQKLYGEELKAVLKRFRKTPEYVSILESQLNDLKMNMDYIVSNIRVYYEDKMSDKVEEMVGSNNTIVDDTNRKYVRNRHFQFRRQSEDPVTPSRNMSGVERLDSYKKLRSTLSVEERNSFKDLGFEFAGHIIHGIIGAVEDDGPYQSTLLPYASEEDRINEHITHDHQVTHTSTDAVEESVVPAEDFTQPPEVSRDRKLHNIH